MRKRYLEAVPGSGHLQRVLRRDRFRRIVQQRNFGAHALHGTTNVRNSLSVALNCRMGRGGAEDEYVEGNIQLHGDTAIESMHNRSVLESVPVGGLQPKLIRSNSRYPAY